jgi:hypothetical protein
MKLEYSHGLAIAAVSCAYLIRASIAPHEMRFAKRMDCRVKPGNDDKQANAAQTREQQ